MYWIESNRDPNGTRSKTPCWVEESYADIGYESEKYLTPVHECQSGSGSPKDLVDEG